MSKKNDKKGSGKKGQSKKNGKKGSAPQAAAQAYAVAVTTPKAILVTRHNNKPTGTQAADPNLSTLGYTRSAELAKYLPQMLDQWYPGWTPADVIIIAAAPSKDSSRPLETVQPLAKALNLTIEDAIADADFDQLALELFSNPEYAGKIVIVCWHHGEIPGLMAALHAAPGTFPAKWAGACFNLILKCDFTPGTLAPTVTQITEPF